MNKGNFQLSNNIKDQLEIPDDNIQPQKPKNFPTNEENMNCFQHGLFGIIFGVDSSRASLNMAFLVFLFAILAGIIFMLKCPEGTLQLVKEFWSTIMPIITMSIGFIFGKKMKG